MTDKYIEELKNEYDYYELKKKFEDLSISIYQKPEIIEQLAYLGVLNSKYIKDDYLRKISMLNYPNHIYENFHKQTGFKYIKCEILNLPIFDLNAKADISPDKTPIIILDFSLLQILDLICYSFITYLFVITGNCKFEFENKTNSQIIIDHVLPTWIAFFKYFKLNSHSDLLKGAEKIHIFSKENHDIMNNSSKLSRSIALFIICHEQAHHELGHIKESSLLQNNNPIEKERKRIHKRELDADKLALKMYIQCVNPESEFDLFNTLDTFYLAPFYFFEMLHSIEWIKEINENNCLYPLAKQRYLNLLDTFIKEKYEYDISINDIEQWYDYFEKMKLILNSYKQ
jgi:hypothetical protein